MINILLIDDDKLEKEFFSRSLLRICKGHYHLDYVEKCSQAVTCMMRNSYDYIFLDNKLSDAINSEFSVPFVKVHSRTAKLIIISNHIEVDYLADPKTLGVDLILDKSKLYAFLESELETRSRQAI